MSIRMVSTTKCLSDLMAAVLVQKSNFNLEPSTRGLTVMTSTFEDRGGEPKADIVTLSS